MRPDGLPQHELEARGFVFGVPGYERGPFDTDGGTEEGGESGDIRGDPSGVFTWYQQSALLDSEPKLHSAVVLYQLGAHELSDRLLKKLSSFEVDALLTMVNARHRAMRPSPEDDDG